MLALIEEYPCSHLANMEHRFLGLVWYPAPIEAVFIIDHLKIIYSSKILNGYKYRTYMYIGNYK